jgi:hypothetical protein
MSKEEHNKEICTIKTIAENNGYNMKTLMKAYGKHKNISNNIQDSQNNDRKIWTRFTYFGDEIRTLTKIFKNSRVRIGYCANNTIKNNCIIPTYKYETCGVYNMKCLTCELVNVGQTGRDFKTRYKEHINDIRQNVEKSRYAVHMLKENHEYGPIEEVMNVIKMENEGKQLDVYERFYIYKATKQKYVMNEQHSDVNNVLFGLIIDYEKTARR